MKGNTKLIRTARGIAQELATLHQNTALHGYQHRAERARIMEEGLAKIALLVWDAEERILLGKEK